MNAFDTSVYHMINGLSGHIRWLDATLDLSLILVLKCTWECSSLPG